MRSTGARRVLRRARIALYVITLVAIVYLVMRYDTLTLPEEGCSPVRSIAPGSRLVVDLWPGTLVAGDRALFRAPDGELLLGVVGKPPESAPQEIQDRVAAGELWIVADDPRCPARDSRALGPIPTDDVAGKVFLSL